jgi:hypothetical protein
MTTARPAGWAASFAARFSQTKRHEASNASLPKNIDRERSHFTACPTSALARRGARCVCSVTGGSRQADRLPLSLSGIVAMVATVRVVFCHGFLSDRGNDCHGFLTSFPLNRGTDCHGFAVSF